MVTIAKDALNLVHDGAPQLASFGLPFARGDVTDISYLRLSQNGQCIPLHAEVTGQWPDGSVRWALCKARIDASGSIDIMLLEPEELELTNANATIERASRSARVKCNDSVIASQKNILCSLFEKTFQAEVHLKIKNFQTPLNLQGKTISSKLDPLGETHTVDGTFHIKKESLRLACRLEVCRETGEVDILLRIHNPQAAEHKGGSWDLGDPGSIIIEDFSLVIQAPGAKASVSVIDDVANSDAAMGYDFSVPEHEPIRLSGAFSLNQNSSGGQHWQSPIHWDANKKNSVTEHGFCLGSDNPGNSGKRQIQIPGMRAMPVASLATEELRAEFILEDFWQNFPIRLTGKEGQLCWALFPRSTELQGGESKTWRLNCRIQPVADDSEGKWPLSSPGTTVCYNPDYLNRCQILPHLAFSAERSALGDLIHNGLAGDSSFFVKREQTDVYGWRHYGELCADHESHGLAEVPYFISHYNNQYDPLMGMTLQYLQHGDAAWLSLIHPLNRHIQDIDIYDTIQDKAEYNRGLFWHTNHYLPAETCSHRSYSRHHTAVYDGYQGGGGPGGQHCYTTGLALQYRLFGDEQARLKVEQLCEWVRCFYNGNGSILDRSFRLLTIDLKRKGYTNIGVKAPGYRYPLDRGTGNYLIALLDFYDLSDNSELLKEVGGVIRQTCHPQEDISSRSLDDIENTWFYTVFLQAVGRYLFLKEALGEADDDYWYARHSLMHYGDWMLANEGFYLDKPELLEFPNDTWCAQELRKANLFCYMYYFAEQENSKYLERAEEFYRYVCIRLQGSAETRYTRLLALMMQNDGVREKFKKPVRSQFPFESRDYGIAPKYSVVSIVFTYLKDVFRLALDLSFKRELNWLSKRLKNRIS
jgi:hypothetical protein